MGPMHLPVKLKRLRRCERCRLLFARAAEHCPHCSHLDDPGLERLQAEVVERHRAHVRLGAALALAAAVLLLFMLAS